MSVQLCVVLAGSILVLAGAACLIKSIFFTKISDLRKQTEEYLREEQRNKKPRLNF